MVINTYITHPQFQAIKLSRTEILDNSVSLPKSDDMIALKENDSVTLPEISEWTDQR